MREVSGLQGLRKATAEHVTRSFATVPHFYLSVEADASLLLRLRDRVAGRIEAEAGVRLTISDLLVKIAARALEEHPRVNATWSGEGILPLDTIDVGLAVATERGLIVPVIRNANHQSLTQIAQSRADVVTRAHQGKLGLQDVQGGSFTISNLGMFRVDQFDAIINSPQSALLAVGRIKERPVAVEGRLAVRPTVFLTLSVDHRVLDGADAARFLDTITALIEEPYLLAQL
ncbi:MAG TPA: hypothetical protein DEP84_18920 [Chloroflexi bacterium]|nr:hypothetical protein [Chloroflexota bacterium]